MTELLYMYIESMKRRVCMEKQEIKFTNDYDIEIEKDFSSSDENNGNDTKKKRKIRIKEKDNIYRNIYGDNIISISALVGINGIGKSTTLDLLGGVRPSKNAYFRDCRYFAIYKNEDKYIIEGNGCDLVTPFIINPPIEDESKIGVYYAYICEYDSVNECFNYVEVCKAECEEIQSAKIMYFRDEPYDKTGFLYQDDVYAADEDNVCYERREMKTDIASVYKTCDHIKNKKDIGCDIDLNNFEIHLSPKIKYGINYAEGGDAEKIRNIWIIQSLIAMVENTDGIQNAEEKIKGLLDFNHWECLYKYDDEKFDAYKKKLIEQIMPKSMRKVAEKFVKVIKDMPEEFYSKCVNEYSIMIMNVRDFSSDEMAVILKEYLDYYNVYYTGLSAGEFQILSIFSSIYSIFLESSKKTETAIVLLDEPDKGLHPELARRFISSMKKIFQGEKDGCRYQIILTTHSPFLISDIPAPYIHCLEREIKSNEIEKEEKSRKDVFAEKNRDSAHSEDYSRDKMNKTIIKNIEFGLLNSIPDLMKDTFFMDAPYGEFGREYYRDIVEEIQGINRNFGRDKLTSLQMKIDAINDEVLRNVLVRKLKMKLQEETENDQIKYYKEQMKYYEKQIEKLQGKNE